MDKFESFLKGKTAKIPNWAWVVMVGGALGVGLYLRSRSGGEENEVEEELGEEAPEGTLGSYEGTEAAGGLAGAGLVGPSGGGLTPVESPEVPEGITTVISEQAGVINQLAGYITEHPNERVETNTITTPAEAEITGGGSPGPTGVHKPVTNNAAKTKEANQKKEKERLTGEIQKLQNEVQTTQNDITTITQNIKSAKAAKQPNKGNISSMEGKRAQAQAHIASLRAQIAGKQAKLKAA